MAPVGVWIAAVASVSATTGRLRYPPNCADTLSNVASGRQTTVSMTNSTDRVEIITSVQRRRRWTAPEKVRMVEETFEPGMTVSLVARRHGVAPNQLFTWRRLVAQGSLTAAGSGEEVVPASDYRTLQNQVRELHRLLGKKTLEAEILKEALEHATGVKKTTAAAAVAAEGRFPSNLHLVQVKAKRRDQIVYVITLR